MYENELMHYGVKGMKWGVRKEYEYSSNGYGRGSVVTKNQNQNQNNQVTTNKKKPMSRAKKVAIGAAVTAGIVAGAYGAYKLSSIRNANNINSGKAFVEQSDRLNTKVSDLVNSAKTKITGKQYVDTYIEQGTTFSRIQTSSKFENHAFYATYKKRDQEKYMGLFGKNLSSRADYDARKAEKLANISGNETDILNAKKLREKADATKVYQLKLENTKKLKVPSDDNASRITTNLLKESDFKKNVIASIEDSKGKMKRPKQQFLFNQAQKALSKDPDEMTKAERNAVYKALNLSLTNHNEQEIAAQNRFYSELKKNGYNALLDYNDKEFSSYHAKRPMIVFDMDSVKLQSVSETDPKVVNKFYMKYNTERIFKEIPANTTGFISALGSMKVSECASYVKRKTDRYLS